MFILFGGKSVFIASEKDFRKDHPFISYFLENMKGTIVDSEPLSDKCVIIRYGTESMVKVSYEDYPNVSDKEIEDIFQKLNKQYNDILVRGKEVVLPFGRSKLTLSRLDYPNIDDTFIAKIQQLLNDYCAVYTKAEKLNTYHTQPIGKYSSMFLNMGDFVELHNLGYYSYSNKIKDLIYTIEYIYDPTKPRRTSSLVMTNQLTNLLTTAVTDYANGNMGDNYANDTLRKLCNILNL